ncbi:hypothetical protein AGDE_16845 [Angomonas deanei]|nr:hypothetical protein AGDE_16845 [Angomonas deanei]|eukprot:EPY16075.1 hypothetical protein AGDE_16845 [Angomonas deanei]
METKTNTKPEDHENVHPDAVVPRGPSTTITMPNHKTTRHKELSVCLLGAANHSNPSTDRPLLNLKRDERKDAPHWKKLSPSVSDRSEESETSSITVPISEESLTTGNDRNRSRTQFLEQMRQNNKMIREKQTEREIFNQHNKVKRITDAENELLNYERMLQLKFNYNAK